MSELDEAHEALGEALSKGDTKTADMLAEFIEAQSASPTGSQTPSYDPRTAGLPPEPTASDTASVFDKVKAMANTGADMVKNSVVAPIGSAVSTFAPKWAERNIAPLLSRPRDDLEREYAENAGRFMRDIGAESFPGLVNQLSAVGRGARPLRDATIGRIKPSQKAAPNPVLEATAREVMDAGYKLPPSLIPGSGVVPRVLEGVSGKFKTNQLAGIKDQVTTDALARKYNGLPDDAPLTSEAMQQIRKDAYAKGYEPVAKVGDIATDKTFAATIDKLTDNRKMAAKSFPNAVADDITPVIQALKVSKFDAGEALQMTQILRDEATAAYRTGNNALGQAKRGAAKAIEDQIERSLSLQGKDGAELLKGFRDARTRMAKSHTTEDAIREGGGMVDAKVFGRRLQAGKPLTEEGATIGKFANNFKDVSGIPQSGHANPFTVLDMFTGLGGAGFASPVAALPLARVAARYGILSDFAQGRMKPKGPPVVDNSPRPLALMPENFPAESLYSKTPPAPQGRGLLSIADDQPIQPQGAPVGGLDYQVQPRLKPMFGPNESPLQLVPRDVPVDKSLYPMGDRMTMEFAKDVPEVPLGQTGALDLVRQNIGKIEKTGDIPKAPLYENTGSALDPLKLRATEGGAVAKAIGDINRIDSLEKPTPAQKRERAAAKRFIEENKDRRQLADQLLYEANQKRVVKTNRPSLGVPEPKIEAPMFDFDPKRL